MIVVVRPWKFLDITMILARPPGDALDSVAPGAGDLDGADSTASAPVFIGSTMSLLARRARASAKGPRRSLWNARLVRVIRSSWSRAACTSTGLPWPKLTAE